MDAQTRGTPEAAEERAANDVRVLVENADQALLWATERVLTRAGYAVTGCPGPEAEKAALPLGRCSMVKGTPCPLAEDADVVIFGLDLHSDPARRVLSGWRTRGSQTPLLLDVCSVGSRSEHELTEGFDRIDAYASPSRLIASVEYALGKPL